MENDTTAPAGDRQDPADAKKMDTAVETEHQPEPTVEHSEPVSELRVTAEPTEG